MALIGIESIAANKWESPADAPRGFLPAHVMGVDPLTPEYVEVLNAILANIEDDLATLGFDNATSDNPYAKRLARHMARYYGAEAVLSNASLGEHRDLEGNQTSLSASDLLMWQRMKDAARDYLNDHIEPETSTSAVWVVGVRTRRSGGHAKTIHYD